MTEQTEVKMINLTIDGKAVSVPKGTTVYTACKQLGIEIPIFCYQDRMPPFGACRVCLVEVEKMPKPQTSCTLEATEGMVVKTQSKIAVDARKGILEFLLINHPLDCPICDRGGECPLQDQTLSYGPGISRFFEEKRRFPKRKPLGPVLMLDRERCIVCARCTRFGDIVAGDHALEFIERGFKTEVGTPDGGPAESKFIGNTIMICPVGALTSDVYRFRARPWDNDSANSTCTLCPVGCSMILDSRDGEIVRTRSLENHDVNDIWLCDKGWFGYEFTYHPDRLKSPMIRQGDKLVPASWEDALSLVAMKFQEAVPKGKLAGLGGNPLSTEENYLFQKLFRAGAEVNHVDHRIGMPVLSLEDELIPPGMEMTIGETEHLSYAFLLGLDLTEEFPVIWLRLKQAINRGAKVIFIGNYAPEIAPHLAKIILHAPGEEIETLKKNSSLIEEYTKEGKKGALFIGSQYLANPQRRTILEELSRLQKSASNLTLNIMEGRGNSNGARLAGMRPDLGPLGQRLRQPGLNALQILEESSKNGWHFLYVAGANPASKYPSRLWNAARSKLDFLVVQDLFLTETARQADVVLPTLSFVEKKGSIVNIEGRVQKLNPGKDLPENVYTDFEIFTFLAYKLNLDLKVDKEFEEKLKGVIGSQKSEVGSQKEGGSQKSEVRSQKGGLKASFAYALFDHGERMKHSPHVIQLSKEPFVRIHPQEARRLNVQDRDLISIGVDGNTIQAKVKLDERVAEGAVVLPLGFEEIPVQELGANLMNGLNISIQHEAGIHK